MPALVACGDDDGGTGVAASFDYVLTIGEDEHPTYGKIRLSYRDKEIPLVKESQGWRATWTTGAEDRLSRHADSLRLEVESPCGWTAINRSGEDLAIDGLEATAEPGTPIRVDGLGPITRRSKFLYIDLDGRGAIGKSVSVGAQRLEVKSDAATYKLRWPDCPSGWEVKVEGRTVGNVKGPTADAHGVIDVLGGHCYELVSYTYAPTPTGGTKSTKLIEGKRVFAFGFGPRPISPYDSPMSLCPLTRGGFDRTCTEVRPLERCNEPGGE